MLAKVNRSSVATKSVLSNSPIRIQVGWGGSIRQLWMILLCSLMFAQATPPSTTTPSQLDPHQPGRTIADVLMTDDRFSILIDALEQAELLMLLRRAEPLTVFAPTNEAFELLGEDERGALFSDPERLREVLGLHLVDGHYLADDLRTVEQVVTLDERMLPVRSDDDIFIENALVIGEDVLADNGVIHLIDQVLGVSPATTQE